MRLNFLFKSLACIFLLFSTSAFAEIQANGLLDNIAAEFFAKSSAWGVVITKHASWLFWCLATISMIWTFGMMALRNADIGEFFSEFIKFTVTTGFFWWLLSNGPVFANTIINSLRQIGAEAAGVPNSLSPSAPLSIGFDIAKKILSDRTLLDWAINPVPSIVALLIMACTAIIGANILIALITAWVLAYSGIFILGFGGSKWTSDMAISYFKSVLSIGLELMVMTLLIGIATSIVDGYKEKMDAASIFDLMLVLCVFIVLLKLISTLPSKVASLSGGGSGSGSTLGMGSLMAAASMGAAAVTSGGAAVAGAAKQGLGAGSAIKEAFKAASAAESAGGGTGGMMSAMKSDAGDSNNSNDLSPLAQAAGDSPMGATSASSNGSNGGKSSSSGGGKSGGSGNGSGGGISKAGRVATGTASILGKSMMAAAKTSFQEKVGETAGGKLAAAIKEASTGEASKPVSLVDQIREELRADENRDDSENPKFDNNSLSNGDKK